MSIRCLQQGRLPALPISPAPMPNEPFITLTEVVSQALYGAPLTPGSNGTLRRAMDAVRIAQLVWHGVRYPPKATAALEIFSEPSPPLAPDEIEKQVEELLRDPPDWFLGCARQFLSTAHNPTSVFNWMAKHDNDFTSSKSSTAEACDRLYRNLSQAVANGRIVLWGRLAAGDGPPSDDHEAIDPKYLLTRRHHDLLSNELHVEVRDGDELLAFSRSARARLSAVICYHDIKTSKAHADVMIASADQQPSGQDDTTATTRTRATITDRQDATAISATKIAPGPAKLSRAIIAADKALWPDGPPTGMPAQVRRDKIRAHLKSHITSISDRTFQRCRIGKT